MSRARGNVLCVANFPSDTGYAWRLMEHFWVQLGQLAAEQGGSAIVAFPKLNGVSSTLRAAKLQVVELPVPTALPASLRSLKHFVREHRIRTVYFTDRHYWSPVYALLRRWGVEHIIVHDHIPGERPRPPRWRLLAKRMLHLLPGVGADLYIGVSEFVYQRLIQVAGVPTKRCTFVRNGVSPAPGAKRDIRRAFNIPANAAVVVSSGRANRYKGIDTMIRGAARLINDDAREDVYFVHFGDGPHLGSLEALVREHHLEGRFILAGAHDGVRAFLDSCTIALHASHGEAFSLAILEFMAAGLPAIVPQHCGNGEAIVHDVNGILYTPGDVNQAVHWLRRLLDEDALRHRLGAAARQCAREQFTLEVMDQNFAAAVRPLVRS